MTRLFLFLATVVSVPLLALFFMGLGSFIYWESMFVPFSEWEKMSRFLYALVTFSSAFIGAFIAGVYSEKTEEM